MAKTKEQITDEVVVGGVPPIGGEPAQPGKKTEMVALPGTEYIAGTSNLWYQALPRALPWVIDDVSRDFGADIYERMMLDAQVRSVVNVLKSAVLEDGVAFRPAVDDKTADGYKQAKKLADAAERMFSDLDTGIDDVLWNMLDAVALGHKIAEQVYELETTSTGKQQYCLTKLRPKPRNCVAFVVDPHMTVVGIAGRIPGQPFPVMPGQLFLDLKDATNVLPRTKFAVYSFRPIDDDPRGTSILRPAFAAWNEKQEVRKEYLKFLTQFASPSLIGRTAEGADPYPATNPDGTPMLNAAGYAVLRTPEQDLLASLEAFANSSALALPYGSEVDVIQMQGAGEAFLNAFAHWDRQIAKAVLNQTLATEEGEHQARAASSTHKDILDTLARQVGRPLERMLRRDVLRIWMLLNGQQKSLDLCPTVRLGITNREDLPRMWGAISSLWASNFLHESQLPELDDMAGLPRRNPPTATSIPVTEQIRVQESGAPGAGSPAGGANNGAKPKKVGQDTPGGSSPSPQGEGKGTGAYH